MYSFLSNPDFRCPIEAIGLGILVFNFVAIWVALGKGRWQIRLTLWGGFIASLLVMKAFDCFVSMVVGGLLTIVVLGTGRVLLRHQQIVCENVDCRTFWKSKTFWIGAVVGCGAMFWIQLRISYNWGMREFALLAVFIFASTGLLVAEFTQRRSKKLVSSQAAPLQMSLRDAMFLTLVGALLLAGVSYATNQPRVAGPFIQWKSILVSALLATCINAGACLMVMPSRLGPRFIGAVGLAGSCLGLTAWLAASGVWISEIVLGMSLPFYLLVSGENMWPYVSLCYLLWVTAFVWSAFAAGFLESRKVSRSESGHPTLQQIGKLWFGLATVVLLFAIGPIAFAISRPLAQPDPIKANASVYQQVINACKAYRSELVANAPPSRVDDALQNVVQLLQQDFSSDWETAPEAEQGVGAESLRIVARRLNSDANAAIVGGNIRDSVAQWQNCLRLGSSLARGASSVDRLNGTAIEGLWQDGMSKHCRQYFATIDDLAVGHELLQLMKRIDLQRESWQSCLQRVHVEAEKRQGWKYRLALVASPTLFSTDRDGQATVQTLYTPTIQAIDDARKRRDAFHRILMLELAIHLSKEKTGQPIETLDELVPEFFDSVPIDPMSKTQQTMRLLIDGDRRIAYSVGIDGFDDGGRPGNISDMYDGRTDMDVETLSR